MLAKTEAMQRLPRNAKATLERNHFVGVSIKIR